MLLWLVALQLWQVEGRMKKICFDSRRFSVSGSVLASFIFFGVPANHLIAASVMAAPGALGFAKLFLPETHRSKTTLETMKNLPKP